MTLLAPALAGLAALPLGWFGCYLIERVPDYERRVFAAPRRLEATTTTRLAAVTGALVVLFVLLGLRFERPTELLVYLGYGFVMSVLALVDIDTLRLPDRLVLPYLAVSVPLVVAVSVLLTEPDRLIGAFTGAAAYFGFLFLVHLAFGARALGFGDVKLAAVMGLYVGWLVDEASRSLVLVLWGMFLGFLSGAVVGGVLFVVRRNSRAYPFGPFLVLGSLVAILLANSLVPIT